MTTRRPGRRILALTIAGTIVAAVPLTASARPAPQDPPDDGASTWLIEVDPRSTSSVLAEIDAEGVETVAAHDALDGYVVEATAEQAQALAESPGVLSVEVDRPMAVLDDVTQDGAPWGLDRLDQVALPLDGRYTSPAAGGSGVRVYVVDTGVDPTHTDLGGRVTGGFTAVLDGRGTADCHGHGTHVAGTVASRTFGVSKSVTVVPVRVLGCDGSGTTSGVVSGIDWIIANHPAGTPGVVNMSLGGGRTDAMVRAVEAATAAGLLVVAAAGNENADACLSSPAHIASALTVGATTRTDSRASFSNWGLCVDAFAPGQEIVSTIPGNRLAQWSGTSMAAPHAAGLAALVLGADPTLTPAAVTSRLLSAGSTGIIDRGQGSPDRLLGVVQAVSVPDAPDTEPSPEPEPELPGAPVGLAASKITTKGLSVSWTAPADAATTFEVERSADGVVWSPVVSVEETSARVNRLAPATRYVVRVRAVSAAGAGQWATVEATTASRPSAPRSPRASSRTPSAVALTWAAPTTSGALVTDYRVEVSRDGRRWTTVRDGVSARTSARVTGLAPSVAYRFRVTPVADTDTAGTAATVRVSTLAAPSAPRNLKVTGRSASTVSVRWTAPARSGAHVTDYRVQVSRDGRRWTTVDDGVSTRTAVRVTGLQRRTSYQVRVIAVAGTAPGTAYGRTTATTLR